MKNAIAIGLFLLTSGFAQAKTAIVVINKIDEKGVGSQIGGPSIRRHD